MPDLGALLAPELSPALRFLLDMGVAVAAALLGGAVVTRFGQPAIVGYVLAGVAIGPFTPGFVGDVEQVALLADIGVVLLLFALGIELSLEELWQVRRVAVGGALVQIALTLGAGAGLMSLFGFELRAALVLGATVAISSTVVLVKLLSERGEQDARHGRIAIGWMIVQDLVTIVFIVTLPALESGDLAGPLVVALGKSLLFLGVAFFAGARLVPLLFRAVAALGSRELFLLAVVSTALLAAFISSAYFGLSIALGAFVAGLLISQSEIAHQAVAEVMPFRDLFVVLLFVSVGMLVDPGALGASLPLIAVLLLVAVPGKALVGAALARRGGAPPRVAILTGAAIAHVGEFSFILASDALELGVITPDAYNLVLGTAVGSIILAPLTYRLGSILALRVDQRAATNGGAEGAAAATIGEVVILGGGRVGRTVARAVAPHAARCVVIDHDAQVLGPLRALGAETIYGDAANPAILRRAIGAATRMVVVALPDPLTARLATERVGTIAPDAEVLARVSGESGLQQLSRMGVRHFADARVEVGIELAQVVLQHLGVAADTVLETAERLHRDAYGGPGGIHL